MLIILLLGLPWALKLLLSLAIIASAMYTVCCHGLRLLPWSIVTLNINSKNQLQLTYKDGRQYEVAVLASTTVSAYLTVVNGQMIEATFWQRMLPKHLVIFPDAADAEAYRQLRVWLRWHKLTLKNASVKQPLS